jgi:hypothetical protein
MLSHNRLLSPDKLNSNHYFLGAISRITFLYAKYQPYNLYFKKHNVGLNNL